MTADLSERQVEALESYFKLLEESPELFGGRELRPIVRDRETIEAFAGEHGVILGVVLDTPYICLVNDLVRSRDDAGRPHLHPYIRGIAPRAVRGKPLEPGAVVVATMGNPEDAADELIVLIEQERHSTGVLEIELPRGFTPPGVPAAEQALVELREETGYLGDHAQLLGTTLENSGLSDRTASYFHVRVTDSGASEHEAMEAIARTLLLTRAQVWERIDSGEVRDSYTVQGLALYERWLRKGVNSRSK